MAVYCVSDLHGCKAEFDQLLEKIHFSSYDEMYILGDVCDRGKNPIPLFQQIMNAENMHLIFGNHDYLLSHFTEVLIQEKRFPGSVHMNEELFAWLHRNGGLQTLDQFLNLSLPECYDLKVFLDRPEYYKQIEVNGNKFCLVHAGFKEHNYAGITPAEVPVDELIWSHIGIDDNPFYGTWLIVGHTPTGLYDPEYDGRIIRREHSKVIHIDCGCVFGRSLGCIRLDDFREFYVPSTYPRLIETE